MSKLVFTEEQKQRLQKQGMEQQKKFLERRKIKLQEEMNKIDVAITNVSEKLKVK